MIFDGRLRAATSSDLRLNVECLAVLSKVSLVLDVELVPELIRAKDLRVLVVLEGLAGHFSCEEAVATNCNFSMVSMLDRGCKTLIEDVSLDLSEF